MQEKHQEIFEKLARLQWLHHRFQMWTQAEHGPLADPTRGQGRVLAMLKIQPEISTKDLSYLLGIRQQSLNELLNKLEKGGYLTRTPSEADRRVMLIRLTDKGRAEQQPVQDFNDIFACLKDEELEAFSGYLDRIIAALEAQVGEDYGEDELENWIRAARSRMGDEQFDRLMQMRGGHHPRHGEGGMGHGWPFGGRMGRRERPGTPPPPPPGPHDPYDPEDDD